MRDLEAWISVWKRMTGGLTSVDPGDIRLNLHPVPSVFAAPCVVGATAV
jgi:hypothetical protein